jgi:hypothetical protein
MTEIELVGDVAAEVVGDLVRKGATGVRLQDITPFDYVAFLTGLMLIGSPVRVILAGAKTSEIKQLAHRTRFDMGSLTGELELGTEWRNDVSVTEPIIMVAFSEEERLGTFHRFTPVRDHNLYASLCNRCRRELSPNQVLAEWWQMLARKEVMRQLSVRRLAEYAVALIAEKARLPEAAREYLYVLGLLPSKTFFDQPSRAQLGRQFESNKALLARIETLSSADRNRLSKSLEILTGNDRERYQAIIGRVLRYNRTGADADRKELWAEDVVKMLELNRGGGSKKGKAKSKATVTTEKAVTEAILGGDGDELHHLGERLREALNIESGEVDNKISIDLVNGEGVATVQVSSPLLELLRRAITPDCFGGVFVASSVDSLENALEDLDRAEFKPFDVRGEKSADERIRSIISAGYVSAELLTLWEAFVQNRALLAKDVSAIAVSPLLAVASDRKLLTAAQEYLKDYEALLSILRDNYEVLSQKSPKGVRTLSSQILTMDVVLVQTRTGVKGLLSPLHPLHLWKFVKLAEDIDRDKSSLDDGYREALSERAENLPHFVTAIFVPEGLISEHAMVLPESGHLQSLPVYQQDDLHFSGSDGQSRIIRLLEKFVALYRHAKARLKLVLVDPPDTSSLLEQIAKGIVARELDIWSLNVSVYRTLDRQLNLGSQDQQLEAIAEVFSDDEARAFILEVHTEQTTYIDIIKELSSEPVHVLAVFDPSTAQVGQFLRSNRSLVHPLVLPKEFRYDAMEDELFITPAATGGMFDLYQSLQSRLNNTLSGSHFGVSSTLGGHFPKTGDLLRYCTWLVLVDRLLDAQPIKGGHMISYEQGARRDLLVLTENLTKFEREFDYQLRQSNFDPSPEAVRELIESSSELIGEGLLGLIRSGERGQDVL